MSDDPDDLKFLVGKMSGQLESLIKSSDDDRRISSEYRKEVREKLSSLSDGVSEVQPLKDRVDKIEPIIEDYKTFRLRLAVAVAIFVGGIALAWEVLKAFLPQIKSILGIK